MAVLRIFLFGTLICFAAAAGGWHEETLIPEKENSSCPLGEEIPCGRVIDVNGTVLRYERGNMTAADSTVPSEDCVWTIRGPPGTNITMETTCYHHVHNGSDTDYNVCFSFENDVGWITKHQHCSNGYTKIMRSPLNEENFTVYYEKGHKYALGFTATFTFLGEPTIELANTPASSTTAPSTSTTSDGVSPIPNYVTIIALCAVFIKLL